MSTEYYGERMAVDATKALLLLLKFGAKKIAELVRSLEKQGISLTPEQTRRLARRLRDRNYVKGSARSGYSLTQRGLERLETLDLPMITAPAKWDGKWRLIMFDIPEDKRLLRNQIRLLIKELRCIKLQHSVWVHPFQCFSQFEQIQSAYGRGGDILFIETDRIEGAPQLVQTFRRVYRKTDFKRIRTK
ncbi:hypothetical protein HY379_02440 [Candidatus Saccharibacteria bacterium]|nr:hypothetical protein [Candidatus Saccharibacteria bacterium]